MNIIKIFIGLIQNNDEFQLLLQKYIAKRFFAGNNIDRDICFAREIAKVDTLDVLSSRIHVMIKDTDLSVSSDSIDTTSPDSNVLIED